MKSRIEFQRAHKWLERYSGDAGYWIHKIEELWERFHLYPIPCKAAIDEMTHDLEPSQDKVTRKCKEVLQEFSDEFGLFSDVYVSVTKMIIDCELDAKEIKKRVKEEGKLPAAFNKSIVAQPDFSSTHIVAFVNNIFDFEYAKEPVYYDKYENLLNMRRYVKRQIRKFFSKRNRVRRLIQLSNGSSTRMEDHVNLQDINASIYVTDEEAELIERMTPILDWLHIDNFRDCFECVAAVERSGTYGSVNYAPDDSGKTRISYCIDSCVQIVSKAMHELLDFIVKDMSCNGTYRQQAVIRNMIRKGYHKQNCTIISTDMSKYSDTLQREKIIQMLEWFGFPREVIAAYDELMSLPLWDSVLHRVTGSTDATYQGQYSDFPLITLKNLFNQMAVYDYVNYTYGMNYKINFCMSVKKKVKMTKNAMNCAVGDDTIMAFPRWKRDPEILFEVIKAVFNRDGVNINLSKTHWICNGKGYCDFVKRMITSDGLVPYLRLQAVCDSDPDIRCEELLRFYRDNMISYELWCEYVDMFLEEPYRSGLKSLHILNGGVRDSLISPDDLRLFYIKNIAYLDSYKNKNADEIRKWIRYFKSSYDIPLNTTHLISFVRQEIPHYEDQTVDCESDLELELEELWSSDDDEGEDDWARLTSQISDTDSEENESVVKESSVTWENVMCEITEDQVEDKIINLLTKGYKYPDLKDSHRLVGKTLEECLYKYEDFRHFFIDYSQSETFRYMTAPSHRNLDVYTRMFTSDHKWIMTKDNIYRYELAQISDYSCGPQIAGLIKKRARDEESVFVKTVFGSDYYYLEEDGELKRLYSVLYSSSYSIISRTMFFKLLGFDINGIPDSEKMRVDSLWNAYEAYMS